MKKIFLLFSVFALVANTFAQQKVVGGYYTNWSVYSRGFGLADLEGSGITQATQAFMFPFVVSGELAVGDEVVYRGTSKTAVILTCRTFTNDDGETCTTGIGSTDFYADIENVLASVAHYGSPSWLSGTSYAEKITNWLKMSDNSKPGVIGQFIMARNNGLETVASLGGWTLAQHFPEIANDINTRAAFAQAVADFATKFKFDGIDLDWEFPVQGGTDGNETISLLSIPKQPHYTEDPMNLVMLCKAIKEALPSNVHLSICTNQNPATVGAMYIFPGNKSNWSTRTYKGYDGSDLTDWVDNFYTMTYDYGGAWLSSSSHQAPLYDSGDPSDPDKDMSVSTFINVLLDDLQVPAERVIMGLPFYGRGWDNVAAGPNGDGLYQASSQTALLMGSWDDTAGENSAAFDYGDLKDGKAKNVHQYILDGVGTGNDGFIEYWSETCKVPYLYNSTTGAFISYDNPRSITEKVKFAMNKGLAGVFTWEFSQDDNELSLVKAMAQNAAIYSVIVNGTVNSASGEGISGVTVSLADSEDTLKSTTLGNGAWGFNVNALSDYVLNFSKEGYIIKPAEVTFKMLEKDTVINVIGSSSSYAISGTVSLSGGAAAEGVELSLELANKKIDNTTSGSDGTYSFSNVPGDFDYTLVPSSNYYEFTPASLSWPSLSSNLENQDFTVDYTTYSISGVVTDKTGNPVEGATINLSGGSTATIQTGSDGTYSFDDLQAKADYEVSIELEDIYYVTRKVEQSLLSENTTIDFSEYAGIAVFGYLKDGAEPISGASVTMTNDWQTGWVYTHSATIDDDGLYSFVIPESVTAVTNVVLKPSISTYYSSVEVPSALSSSLRVDFNTQEISFDLMVTAPLGDSVYPDSEGNVALEVEASVSEGSITGVEFEVDGQTLTATNSSGNTWQASWTPSAVFADYEIKVTATRNTGATASITKDIYVDCNTDCPNKKPEITLNSPTESWVRQESFSEIIISADIIDSDGTIESVNFSIDGIDVTPTKTGDTYSYNFVPDAYKTYSIEITVTDDAAETTTLVKEYAVNEPVLFTPLPSVAIVGYWQNWLSDLAPFIPLSDLVTSNYTVIDISFGVQSSTEDDHIVTFTPDASGYPDVQDFIDDVALLKAAGKPVILSLGGETGHFSLESETDKDAFVASLKTLIDTYGFDGIDIDFEGVAAKLGETSSSLEYSTLTSERSKYLIDALNELTDYYGEDFILTFAEELYYVQVGYNTYPGTSSGDFLPVLYNLWDKWDLLHVQYYNYGSEWWMGSDKQETYSAELVTQELELLLTGFTLGSTGNSFPAIEPSRLAIGLPCTCSASGTVGIDDYNVPIDDMIEALEYLRTGEKPEGFAYTTKGIYEPIRGMMTWSINWDATDDCEHTPYDFADRYYEYFNALANEKPVASITSAANNEIYNTGTVTIEADATDSDGTVASVDFYVNSVKVGSDDTAPYTYDWEISATGTYKLYVVAVDDKGKEGKSSEITVQVVEQGAPEVSLTYPLDGAEIMPEEELVLTASASDEDGTVSKVSFYDGETLLAEVSQAPFKYTWSNATPGVHEIKVVATDNDDKTATSVVSEIMVYTYYAITGTITKGDGLAYNGVGLSLQSEGNATLYTETDLQGEYSFSNVLSFTDYVLTPSSGSNGVFIPEESVISNLSGDIIRDFSLYEGTYIYGYVKDGTTPVTNAVIQIVLNWTSSAAGYVSLTVTTDSYGYYRYEIPDAYIDGMGGTVKMNAWDNSNVTYYPTDGYTFSTFNEVVRCDFNAQENSITIEPLTASSVDVELSGSVSLEADVTISSGDIESVSFAIDGQTLSGINTSGNTWAVDWTPSSLDAEYELVVTASGEGITEEASQTIYVNCTGEGCPNKKPVITLLSPTASVEQQETFAAVSVSASVTDADGTVASVTITVDGNEQAVNVSGDTYSCTFTPSEYKTYTIVITATDDADEISSTTKEYTIRVPSAFTPYPDKCITGYWHNWLNTSAPFMPLKNVLNTKFNVVIVSFIETENTDGYTPIFEPLSSEYPDPEVFKDEVKMLQDAGIPVLISIGGQNGHVELTTEEEKNIYVNGIIQICEEYGFDGIDVDYEGGSMTAFNPESNSLEYADITDPELKYGIDAIREVHEYFGNDFLITAAPETAYVQDGHLNYPGAGQFLPFIYNIRDILTCLHVQLYNYGNATWSHLQDVSGTPGSLSAGTADAIVGLTEMLVTGFPLGSSGLTFPALREDQVAIGLLASPNAGGSIHYTEPAEVTKALDYLIKGEKDASLTYPLQVKSSYPDIRGMMTWSINWDAVLDGRDVTNEFADTYYDYFMGNQPPSVEITSPADGDILAPGNIILEATASDPEGDLQSVSFYAGEELVGTATSAPYSVTWAVSEVGTYQLTARATDGDGKTGESDTISVEIFVEGAPEITAVRPNEGQSLGVYNLGTDALTLKAKITDADNSLTGDITFTIAGEETLVASTSGDDIYQVSWVPSALGDYTLVIEATNAIGKAKKEINFSVYDAADVSLSFEDIANTSLFNDAGLYTRTVDQVEVNLGKTATFTFDQSITEVTPRSESLAKITVLGSSLTIQGYRTGRTGLQITAADGKVYLLGLRVNESDGTPPGLPDYASVGSIFENTATQMSFWTDLYGEQSLKNKNIDVLYIYYQGGPTNFMETADPERNLRMQRYARNCVRLGVVPSFVYYNIPNPDESYAIDIENLSTEGFIDDYYNTMNVFIDAIQDVLGDRCFQMIMEPDFLGYMLQGSGSSTTDPSSIALYGDYTVSSFVTGVNEHIQAKKNSGANIIYGWQFNLWADDTYNVNPSLIKNGYSLSMTPTEFDTQVSNVETAAANIINFGVSAGVTTHGAGFVAMDRYGNAPGESNPESAAYWYNNDQGINYLLFAQKLNEVSSLPVVLWQLPTGRINNTSLVSAYTGETFAFDDNLDWCVDFIFGDTLKPQYSDALEYDRYAFFDDNFHNDPGFQAENDTVIIPSHIARFKDYGIISAQFGMGLGGAGQSATVNPGDDYYFIQKTQKYYTTDLAYVNDEVIYPEIIYATTTDGNVELVNSHPAGSNMYYAVKGCSEDGTFSPGEAGVGTHWVTFQYNDNSETVYKAQKIVVTEGIDTEAPVLTAFECNPYTNTTLAEITKITATDNVGVSGYYIAEDNTTEPASDAEGWLNTKPSEFTLSSAGEHVLTLWVKDAAGNISSGLSATVTYDDELPVISEFTGPASTETATVSLSITANDNIGIAGYFLAADNTTPEVSATGWEINQPESYTLPGTGEHLLFLWVKDEAGNISEMASLTVSYISNDNTSPTILAFSSLAETSVATVSLTIDVSDDTGVTGYYLSEDDDTAPTLSSTWLDGKPANYVLSGEGAHTLYLWVKDEAGNISEVASTTVTYSEVVSDMSIALVEPEALRFYSTSASVNVTFVFEVDAGGETLDRVYAFIDGTEYTAGLVDGSTDRYEVTYTTSEFKEYAIQGVAVATSDATASTPTGIFILNELSSCPVSEWNNSIDYSGGSYIYYSGQIYKANYYISAGETPEGNTSWELMGDCNSLVYPVYNCDDVSAWDSEVIYGPDNTDIDVSYNGLVYRAGYYANGTLLPDAGGPWVFQGVCTDLNDAPVVTSSFVDAEVEQTPLATVTLSATITDTDGSIADVRFYINGEELMGVQNLSETDVYTVDWNPSEYGVFAIEIKATDNELATTSLAGTVNVIGSQPPVFSNVYPVNGQTISTIVSPETDVLTLKANVTDSDGTISSVTFTINNIDYTGINTTGDTWSVDWTPSVYGSFELEIIAEDNSGTKQQVTSAFELVNPGSGSITATDLPLQIWANLGTTKVYTLTENLSSVSLRNPSLARVEVSDNTITIDAYRTGRTGLQMVTTSNDTLYLGLRINSSDGTAPGMPDFQSVGFMSEDGDSDIAFWEEINDDETNTNVDVRYIYINGGPIGSTDNTWRNASRHIKFAENSLKYGLTPFFVFYNIPGGNESYVTDIGNARNADYMTLYFQDLEGMIDDMIDVMGDELFGIILEPDFLGYMQQLAVSNGEASNDPSQIATAVGTDEIATGAGTVKTLVERINKTISDKRKEGANVFFGWQINLWSSSQEVPANMGIMRNTDDEQNGWSQGRQDIIDAATATVGYAISAGITSNGADFVSMDKYGFDAEGYGIANSLDIDNNPWWFNSDHWNNYLLYANTVHEVSGKDVVLWQLPVGRINGSEYVSARTGSVYEDLPNTEKKYEDSSIDYFFGDTFTEPDATRLAHFAENEASDPGLVVNGNTITWASHMDVLKESGIIHAQFGAGVGLSTDGIGFPPEDDWFSIQKIQDYYLSGVDWLPTAPFVTETILLANVDKQKSLPAIHENNARNYYGKACTFEGLFNAGVAGLGEHYITFVEDGMEGTVYKVQKITVENDTEAPVITEFSAESPVAQPSIDLTITVTDNFGTDGIQYFLSEENSVPDKLADGWTEDIPQNYTLSGDEGTYTIYLWAMDESGNISNEASVSVVYDLGVPEITLFESPALSAELTVAVNIMADDDVAVTGYYLIADVSSTPEATAEGWVTEMPESITLTEGEHTLYLWVKDADGNISAGQSTAVSVDSSAPVINSFSCPANTSVAEIALTIDASDNNGITGYYLAEDDDTPPVLELTWLEGVPASYTLSGIGSHTLYLWARDEAGNISEAASTSVIYDNNEEPTHFTTVWSGNGYNHMTFLVIQARMNGIDLSAGDEIGIFDQDLCVGAAVLTDAVSLESPLNMVASADDGTGNGYTEGDTILYKVYLKSSDEEIEICSVVYTENGNVDSDGKFKIVGTSVVSLDCDNIKEQTLDVVENWNMISAFVQPSAPSMSTVFENAVNSGNLYKVIDQRGYSYEDWGVYGGWKNNIGDFSITQGYQLKASADFVVTLSGTSVQLPLDISLTGGWNIISFPSTQAADASEVFADLINQNVLRKVMDEEGSVLMNLLGNNWTNNIGNLIPGKGYLVYVYSDCSLTINSGTEKSSRIVPQAVRGTHFVPVYKGNGYFHMDIHIPDLSQTGLDVGDEIAFFDGDRCVGSAKVSSSDIDFNRLSIACSSDDNYEDEPNGFVPGNTITAKVFHNGEDKTLVVEYLKGVPLYERGGTAVINFSVAQTVGTNLSENSSFNAHIYPNPSDSQFTIEVTTGDQKSLEIQIIDVTGSIIRRIYKGEVDSEYNVFIWNGETDGGQIVSPGVYFCKINDKVIRLIKL